MVQTVKLPVGPLFSVINGATSGASWTSAAVRVQLRRLALNAGVRRRFAPHELRHAHAVEMAREGVPLNVIQRQLGHANLGVTSIYLQGIDNAEIIDIVHARRAPMIPAAGCAWPVAAVRPGRERVKSPTDCGASAITRERVLSLLHSEIVFDATRRVVDPKTYVGMDGMRRMLGDRDEIWKEFRTDPRGFIDAGSRVVVGRQTQGSGIEVQQPTAHVFTVHDGRVVRWELGYCERRDALEAAGLSEH